MPDMDRDEVIKGLMELHGSMETMVLIRDAIALLREQESVEPLAIRKDIVDEVYDWIAECPACGMTWAMWYPDRMRFCPGCGKAVKWDA